MTAIRNQADRLAQIAAKKARREARSSLKTPVITKETATMARRKKSSAPPPNLPESEKRQKIAEAFPELRRLLLDIIAKREEHLKPLTAAVTRLKRRLKADTGTEWADIDPLFRLYMREQMAEEIEETADAERIRANLKRAFLALKEGETLDLLTLFDVAEGVDKPEPDAFEKAAAQDVDAEPETESEGHAAAAAPLDAQGGNGELAEEPEPEPAPDADWAAAAAADDASFDEAGTAYNEAVKAGAEAFHLAAKIEDNPYPAGSVLAKAWERGFADEQPAGAGLSDAVETEGDPEMSGASEDDAESEAHIPADGDNIVHLSAAQ
jgi:hypothetical protein